MESEYSVPCPQCGGTQFEIPEDAGDDTFVTCDQCGFDIQLADLREHGIEHVKEQVYDDVRKQLKKALKNFK